ncbi:MAG: hypothetical protein ACK56F_13105, partial [bacterium]
MTHRSTAVSVTLIILFHNSFSSSSSSLSFHTSSIDPNISALTTSGNPSHQTLATYQSRVPRLGNTLSTTFSNSTTFPFTFTPYLYFHPTKFLQYSLSTFPSLVLYLFFKTTPIYSH